METGTIVLIVIVVLCFVFGGENIFKDKGGKGNGSGSGGGNSTPPSAS